MANGDLWTVVIGYDGTNLTVTLTDPAKGTAFNALSNYAINFANTLGQNTAFVGFTAGTGSGYETHDIVDWSFANTTQLSQPQPVTSVPTLSEWALGALAVFLAAIGVGKIRRATA